MADENQSTPPKKEEAKAPASGPRRYSYIGTPPKNIKIVHQYGNLKIKPWAMTDDEIDVVIKRHPDLKRLWKDTQAATKQ